MSEERTTGLNLEHNMHKDEAFLHSTANGALCQAIRCAYLTASRETADPKSAALTLLEAYLAAQATMITVLSIRDRCGVASIATRWRPAPPASIPILSSRSRQWQID